MTIPDVEDRYLPWAAPQFRADPYPWYRRLQQDHPVYELGGEYVVSRYADVVEFAKRPTMSVETSWANQGAWAFVGDTLLGVDPPVHTQRRRQINRWVTPKAVKDWAQTTAAVAGRSLDRIGDDGLIEAWTELAVLPTHATMCEILGLPADDPLPVVEAMFGAMQMMSAAPRDGDDELGTRSFAYLEQRVRAALARPDAPQPGRVAAALVAARDAGEMTDQQVIATLTLFFSLGHMDVGYLIASGLDQFAQRPEVFETYRSEPASRAAIINEMVRIDPPELSAVRYPTEDVTIQGVQIPAGAPIRFMLGAANRDPDVFTDPDEFDHTRPQEQSRNLSFGVGPHGCVGQALSRAEAEAVFTEVAHRYTRIEPAGEPVRANHDFARFYEKLPLRLRRTTGTRS